MSSNIELLALQAHKWALYSQTFIKFRQCLNFATDNDLVSILAWFSSVDTFGTPPWSSALSYPSTTTAESSVSLCLPLFFFFLSGYSLLKCHSLWQWKHFKFDLFFWSLQFFLLFDFDLHFLCFKSFFSCFPQMLTLCLLLFLLFFNLLQLFSFDHRLYFIKCDWWPPKDDGIFELFVGFWQYIQ